MFWRLSCSYWEQGEDAATKINTVFKDVYFNFSRDNDKTGKIVSEIADLKYELEIDFSKLIKIRRNTFRMIEQLSDTQICIIYKRYFENKTWDIIANEMHYNKRWVLQLHNRALEKLEHMIIDEKSVV